MVRFASPTVVVFLASLTSSAAAGAAVEDIEFFETSIRPLLARHCYQCHSEDASPVFGGLRLDSGPALMRGGQSGPVVVPGDPDASRLIQAVRYRAGGLAMPPTGKLADRDLDALALWVSRGAFWPEEHTELRPDVEGTEEVQGEEHWAWQPLVRPEVPSVSNAKWPVGAIDRFVLTELEAHGLSPVDRADPLALLRRVTLDLTGLPPTINQIRAFEAAPRSEALRLAVDRLLASPEFGERWGRHWLDLTGYADTLGLGRRIPSRHAWRYRDYVIDAFNRDKPYDQFVREQVAGDVLDDPDDLRRREQTIATGFLAIGPWALVDQDKAQLQMDVVDNQLDTLGRAVLGVTIGCARCHDHKFDPLPQSEYYALAGIFRSTVTLDARMSGVFSDVHRTRLPETPEEMRDRADAMVRWEWAYAEALAERDKARQRVLSLEAELERIKSDDSVDSETVQEAQQRVADARKERSTLDREAGRILHYTKPVPPTALAMTDHPEPEDTHVRLGGNPHTLGERVPRGFLSLAPLDPHRKIANRRLRDIGFQKSSGRLELAEWLTDPQNALTARVVANRLWHHLFGVGIVASVDNFGALGDPPSHPELLDYLAVRLKGLDWSIKALVREIVLSSTYALSAMDDPEGVESDPENRLLWRSNRRRLEAEAIRDGVLLASGMLDRRAGGPSLPLESRGSVNMGQPPLLVSGLELPSSHRNRRTVYLPVLRKSQLAEVDVLNLFDFPDPNITKGNRDVTTVPTQALYLMNSPFLVKQSEAAAKALLQESGLSDEERVGQFTLRALGRPASMADVERAMQFLRQTEAETGREGAWARYCHAVFASNEFLFRS